MPADGSDKSPAAERCHDVLLLSVGVRTEHYTLYSKYLLRTQIIPHTVLLRSTQCAVDGHKENLA